MCVVFQQNALTYGDNPVNVLPSICQIIFVQMEYFVYTILLVELKENITCTMMISIHLTQKLTKSQTNQDIL